MKVLAEHNFNGLVGCWRVCDRRPAGRGDKRTGLKKGDTIIEDKNMDGPRFEKMLRQDVIPAIREKMAWAKVVQMQFDNAPGHHTKGTKADEKTAIGHKIAAELQASRNRSGAQRQVDIGIFPQEPNSPCTNLNDLGFYNSMDSRLPAYRDFKLDAFEKQVQECFWSYTPEKLDKLCQTKKAVCVPQSSRLKAEMISNCRTSVTLTSNVRVSPGCLIVIHSNRFSL